MRPADSINDLIKKLQLKASADLDARVHDEISRALAGHEKTQSVRSEPSIWRTIMKSKTARLAVAAVIILAFSLSLQFFGGSPAWAEVVQALSRVRQVHIRMDSTIPNFESREVWICLPDHLREREGDRVVIDDGKTRMEINESRKIAWIYDSFLEFKSLYSHEVFDTLYVFRGETEGDHSGVTVKLLESESGGNSLVYRVSFNNSGKLGLTGKAWVNADTLLPEKVVIAQTEAELTGDAGSPQPRAEVMFDYAEIPEEIFAVEAPAGYREVARRSDDRISGVILDEEGHPTPGAKVHVADRMGGFTGEAVTGDKGEFAIRLPQIRSSLRVNLPVMIRAFLENDPDRVAWTILRNESAYVTKTNRQLPGKVGAVTYHLANNQYLKSATGIELQMEPAGRIFGTIASKTGEPVTNASVMIQCKPVNTKYMSDLDIVNLAGSADKGAVVVRTDARGFYEAANLPRFWDQAQFKLTVEAPGQRIWQTAFISDGPLENRKLDITLPHFITVSGILTDNYGRAIPDKIVSPTIDGISYHTNNTRTDRNGRFVLRNVPASNDILIKALTYMPSDKNPAQYPTVYAKVAYQKGRSDYEIAMTAEKPEFVIHVEVIDSTGKPLPDFPVCIAGDADTFGGTLFEKARRTDKNGKCSLTEIPNLRNLRLRLDARSSVPADNRDQTLIDAAKERYKDYHYLQEFPINVVAGRKEYHIKATVMTSEEKNKDTQ